ncbi:MAG: MarR family winged helix-turn-helix transcriptional regulator [Planctomycetia bacterium]
MMMKTLKDELKKSRPFDSPEQEAYLNLVRTADRLSNRFLRLFRDFGLTPSQYNVLRILRGAGKPLPCLEIADRMVQVVPAITGLIDRLEKQELVGRCRCDKDRRVVYVTATPKALELLESIDDPVMKLHRELLGHMSAVDLNHLSRLSTAARRNVDASEETG